MESQSPPIEGNAVEVPEGGRTQPGAQMVQASVIRPLDVREVKATMDTYQQGLRSILDDSDWQNTGDGRFVKKSGWRKIATWFGLSVSITSQRVERDEEGMPLRASVIARATAANGRYSEGDGHCSVDERRFSGPRGNKSKLENDLIATATTRAKNRAISDLVGMGAVSAEEIEGTTIRQGPEFGDAASDELQEKLTKALRVFVGDEKIVPAVEKLAADAGGYLPRISARAVCLVLAERLGTAEREAEREEQVVDASDVEFTPTTGETTTTEGVTDGGDSDEADARGEGDDASGGEGREGREGSDAGAERGDEGQGS